MSRKKKRYATRPVLYIQQPDFKAVPASMQTDYFTPKVEKEAPVSQASVPTEAQARTRKSKKKTKVIPELETPLEDSEKEKDEEEKRELNEEEKDEELVQEVEAADKEEEVEPQSKNIPTKKPFSEMTIEEQVDYLATKPAHIPKMKCEIIAKTARYRGIITAFDDNIVQIETFKRPKFHQVDMEEIESIRLLGF
ncbi:CotO family spore coat protein [Paraliobacillus zengyii]|uniref:CotO family spore coat protein n=1 Tax=Paraliobacillus zengyii TaxID=2213194 RepID=UPI000DD4382B|nr:CotO family spore coat protein [Paraliobacillus zengyii]